MSFFSAIARGLGRLAHEVEAFLGLHPARTGGEYASETEAPAGESTVSAKAGNAQTAERIRQLGDLLDVVWSDVTGRAGPMPPQAKEVALAQAAAEMTSYGQGWEMVGNVGSYQCGGAQTGTAYYDCVPHADSRPDPAGGGNTTYTTTFRKYKAGQTPDGKDRSALEAGAWDFLESIAVKPFPAVDQLVAGDVLSYARKQYGQHYFEGFNLSQAGRDAYADSLARVLATDPPIRRAGETAEGVAGRIVFYAAAMARHLPEIAAALGAEQSRAVVPPDLAQPWLPSYQASASDPKLAGFGDEVRAGWHDLLVWLGFRHILSANDNATEPLSARRRAALAAVAEVVPSAYGDARFAKLAPGWTPETAVQPSGAFLTTCGYLPGYVGSRLGLEKDLSSFGTYALRDNARAWGAWSEPGTGRLRRPRPGDAYALADDAGGVVHVGVVVSAPEDGPWQTADAGQGTREAQEARYVTRAYDPAAPGGPTLGGPAGPRRLAGWVDLDLVPEKEKPVDHPLAGLVRPREAV